MMKTLRDSRFWVRPLAGVALVGLLVWQGRHIAHLIPQAEAAVAGLGAWGPIAYMLDVALLSPLLFPDSMLGLLGGFVFGLGAGTVYYFVAVYAANFAIAGTWLRGPVMRFAESYPKAQTILRGARRDALRLTLLIRLVPVNFAFVSYLLGAGQFPWRAVVIGNLALVPHLFLAVYVGDAAHRATTLTTRGSSTGHFEDAAMLLGLVAAGCVIAVVTGMATRAMAELEAPGDG
jgi:uncharacterized membrane protein YdjX (TVP38/TMEM64 family)